VSGYEVLGELGRGGMGVVYQARHARLGRVVALKMLLGGAFAGPQERERFRREAEAAARLQHPHIVQVFEVGEEKGCPFLALEYVDGGSLDQKLQGTPLPAPEAARLAEALARAVHYAHQRSIIHRDLKPSNILLACSPGALAERSAAASRLHEAVPKIADFGLAKQLDAATLNTQSGAVLGTPDFMAPEQAAGAPGAVGPAADVYALGAILYYLLTGRPPFLAATPLDTLLRVRSEEPVAPSVLQPTVPRDLDTVCLKCLQKSPDRRYDSAAQLADDLGRFLAGEPVRARPTPVWERTAKWVKRRPAPAALLAVSLAAVIALAVGGAWFTRQVQDERDKADEESRKAKRQEQLAKEAGRKELRQRKSAEAENARYRRTLYAAHIHLAHQAWQDGHVGRVRELLEGKGCPPDLRGWEWHYLRGLCHKDLYTIRTRDPISLAFRPDGRRLASGSLDGTVRLWDVARGRRLHTLRGHRDRVAALAFRSDGWLLVSGGDDGTVRLWDPAAGRLLRTLSGNNGWVRCLAFSPDDRLLASGQRDGTVKLWDTTAWQIVRTLQADTDLVESVVFSPDGRRLAAAGAGRAIRLWDVAGGKRVRTFWGHAWQVSSLAFSPDGKTLASGSEDATVRLWEVSTGRPLRTLYGHAGWARAVAFRPDGRFLASAGTDTIIRFWDVRQGEVVKKLRGHAGLVHSVVFSPDGRLAASAAEDGSIKFWDTAGPPQEARTLATEPGPVECLAFSPDRRRVAVAYRYGILKIWDTTGRERLSLTAHGDQIHGLAFSPNGHRLASGSHDKTVKVWDAATGRLLRTLGGHAHFVRGVAFHPDGRRLAAACFDGTITLWDVRTGRRLRTLQGHKAAVIAVAFHPCGRLLASASDDGTVKLWDVTGGQVKHTLAAHAGGVQAVAFSPRGEWLASAGNDQAVRLWSVGAGRVEHVLRGHTGFVSAVAFSPDGRRLASGGQDLLVKLWDVPSGQEVLSLPQHKSLVYAVAFSPDGRWLASGGGDPVHLWEALGAEKSPSPPAALSPDPSRVLAWHRRQATECEQEGQWFAAAWHLDRLIAQEAGRHLSGARWDNLVGRLSEALADYRLLYQRRANARAEAGQWGGARRDFALVLALGAQTANPWRGLALAHLGAGDVAGYRQVCERMRRRLDPAPDPVTAATLAWTCLVVPDAVQDYRGMVRDLERAAARHPTSCYFYHPLGAVLYRAGRTSAAVANITQALHFHTRDGGTPYDALFLALAHHRLGHREEARQWLDRAGEWIDRQQHATPVGSPRPLFPWFQRLELALLHREARAALEGTKP
jgi:WD40 repeat protein